MSLSRSLRFDSKRFDHQSELPEEFNAGNRFYGRDVAEFLAHQLSEQGYPAHFLDEDWGWLVESDRHAPLPFEVAVYHLNREDDGQGQDPGSAAEWGLWVRCYQRRKLLGFLPRITEIAVPEALFEAVEAAVVASGARPQPWEDGAP